MERVVDIIHVSDLHYRGLARSNRLHDQRWRVLCDHVEKATGERRLQPRLIVCSGDLIESPFPLGQRALRYATRALVRLAEACGFEPYEDPWPDNAPNPSDVWWRLLDTRLLLVPGNHDVFPMGLRCLWAKYPRLFRKILRKPDTPCSELETLTGHRIAASATHPAILLDSNGGRAFLRYATGEVSNQTDLKWSDQTLEMQGVRVCVLHAHPVQVPFHLTGSDAERLMVLENSGILLRNLANLGVDLVLHGHRHYPLLTFVGAQRSSDMRLRHVAVVGAGSATKPPRGWANCSFNILRCYRDRSVDNVLMTLQPGADRYVAEDPVTVKPGDYFYTARISHYRVLNGAGDVEGVNTFQNLQVSVGCEELRSIPFHSSAGGAKPARAVTKAVLLEGPPGQAAEWDPVQEAVLFHPPLSPGGTPVTLETRFVEHNVAVMNELEAAAMSMIDKRFSVSILGYSHCRASRLGLKLEFPFPGTAPGLTHFVADVLDDSNQVHVDATQVFRNSLLSNRNGEIEVAESSTHQPERHRFYRLARKLAPASLDVNVELDLVGVRAWHRAIAETPDRSEGLNDVCRDLAHSVSGTLGELAVSLFIPAFPSLPSAATGQKEPAALLHAGSYPPRGEGKTVLAIPFGKGVGGRAWRTAKAVWYERLRAEQSALHYRIQNLPAEGVQNFYYTMESVADQACILACPVLPTAVFAKYGTPDLTWPYTLLVVCLGTEHLGSPLSRVSTEEITAIIARLQEMLESTVWDLACR